MEMGWSPFLATLALCMAVILHVSDRMGVKRSGLRVVLPLLALLSIVYYVTDTISVFAQLRTLVGKDGTSLRSAAGITKLCRDLQQLAKDHVAQVMLLLASLYLLLQTFCIPGTVVLNAALGSIVGTLAGVPLCTLLGTAGACACYALSSCVGVSLVEAADGRLLHGTGLPKIRAQVRRFKADLFVYVLFLRLTPILPNWLVNLASPVAGVPLPIFASATCVGILPQTYWSVRFGALARTNRAEGARMVSLWDTLLLAVVGVAALAGLRLKKRFVQ